MGYDPNQPNVYPYTMDERDAQQERTNLFAGLLTLALFVGRVTVLSKFLRN